MIRFFFVCHFAVVYFVANKGNLIQSYDIKYLPNMCINASFITMKIVL